MSKVKNPKLAKQGKIAYEWARTHMDILDNTLNRLKKSKPLKGVTVAFCLHITKETSHCSISCNTRNSHLCMEWSDQQRIRLVYRSSTKSQTKFNL